MHTNFYLFTIVILFSALLTQNIDLKQNEEELNFEIMACTMKCFSGQSNQNKKAMENCDKICEVKYLSPSLQSNKLRKKIKKAFKKGTKSVIKHIKKNPVKTACIAACTTSNQSTPYLIPACVKTCSKLKKLIK